MGDQSNAAAPGGGVGRPPRVPASAKLPPLVPRSSLAVIDEAVAFLRVDPLLMFGVAFTVLIPLRVIALAVPGSALRDARPDQFLDVLIGNLDAPGAVFAAFVTLVLDSVALFTVAVIYGRLLSMWFSSTSATLTELLLHSIRRSPFVLLGWLLVHIVEAGAGLAVFGVGLVVTGPLFIVVAPLMGAEGLGPVAAFQRSANLCVSRYLHCLSVFAFSGLAAFVIRAAIRALPATIGLELLNLPGWAVAGFADVVATVVVTGFVAAVANILYLDLRVVREGIDLDMAQTLTFADRRSVRNPTGRALRGEG